MFDIHIERQPRKDRLDKLDVHTWPIWSKEISSFPWTYDEQEICYFLEGEVIVTPVGETPVQMGKGDLVTFPAGMSCFWDIRRPVRKYYRFG